jgi:catechol 2,3-dioxygenase-like lactoylglutathione lyase family enzyme
MLTHIQVVSIPVTDQRKSRAFYADVLGFQVIRENPWDNNQQWIELAPVGSSTSISLVTWFPNMQPGGISGLVLNSDDLDADYATLSQRGVKFRGPINNDPWGRSAVFNDPDGNAWVINETTTIQQ